MANLKDIKQKVFGNIAALQTILDNYPELMDKENSFISINSEGNSISFMVDVLNQVGGRDNIIAAVSKFLTLELEAIELSIKSILATNFRNMIACGINPLISDELLRDGIWFDLNQIDTMGYLMVNPLDRRIGKYYYFGCDTKDGINITSDLHNSLDMNAVIWYTINCAVGDHRRVVWYNKNSLSEEERNNPNKVKPVVTLEFCEQATSMTNSEGGPVANAMPLNNVLHVFLGDASTNSPIRDNRYWKKTLLQFNLNYIRSVKLFDPKVVTAQILNNITGLLSMSISAAGAASVSITHTILDYQINKLVERVVEQDDIVIDDCFFTFSNDEYNEMLNRSDLMRAGLFSYNGEMNTNNVLDPAALLANIDGVSEAATKEEQATIIEGAMRNISATLSKTYEEDKYGLEFAANFNVEMNFINQLIKGICSAIIKALISPKVYMLFLINFKLMGYPGALSPIKVIGDFNQIFISIIRLIKDLIVKFLYDYFMSIVKPMLAELASKFAIERAIFYKELLESLIKACSWGGQEGVFTQDIVNYADILTESSGNPQTVSC